MVEHAELLAVVHTSVATSKELATTLQDSIVESRNGFVTVSTSQAQSIATQLRITANLVMNLIEENSQMLDRISDLVDRQLKKD